MANRVAETILKYTVDQASVAASKRAIADLKGEQQQLSTSLGGFGASTQADVNAVRMRFKYLRDEVSDARTDLERLRGELDSVNSAGRRAGDGIEDLRAELLKTQRAARDGLDVEALRSELLQAQSVSPITGAAGAGGTSSLNRFGSNLQRFGYNLRALPAIGPSEPIARISQSVGAGLAKTSASLASVGAAAGIAGVALAAVAVAFVKFNEGLEQNKRRLDAALAAQQNYYDAVQNLTSDQAREQIATLERTNEIIAAQIEETQRVMDDMFAAFVAEFGDAAARLFDNQSGVAQFRERLEDLQKQYNTNADTITRYTGGLETNAFAANDAEAAERALTAARVAGARAAGERARGDSAENREFIQLTQEQAQERVASLRAEGEDIRAGMAALIAPFGTTLDEFRANMDAFIADGASLNEAARQALEIFGVPPEVIDAFNDYRAQLGGTEDDLYRLISKYIPLIEAREREEQAIAAIIAGIDQRIAGEIETSRLLREGTTEQIDSRVTALNDERAAILANLPALKAQAQLSDAGRDALLQYQARLSEVNDELRRLEGVRPDVAIRQFRASATELARSLSDDVAKIRTDRDAKIADIRADLAAKELEAERTRAEALTEARDKAQAEREDQEVQHQDNLRRIISRANSTIANAVANRDALAAFMAQQQRDEELEEEQKANAKRVKEIQKREGEQLKVIEKRYSDQLRTAQQAAQRAISLEVQKAQAEIALRGQAYNAELQQLQSALFAQYGLQNQFWTATYNLAARTVASISGIQVQAARTTQLANLYTQPNVKKYASGGYPSVGQTVLVGENGPELARFMSPARVYSNEQSRAMAGGGMTINIPVTAGMNARQIVQTVDARLYDTLKKAGVPD